LYYTFGWCSSETPSTRRIKFCFDVPKISTPTGNAVRDILRWYKNTERVYEERSTNPGFIDDKSLHAPIMVNIVAYRSIGDDHVQFAVDPLGDVLNPGADPKAITQTSVDDYYPDDTNVDYLDTWELPPPQYEPAPYIIYFFDYGNNGFVVEPVAWEQGKPVMSPLRSGHLRYRGLFSCDKVRFFDSGRIHARRLAILRFPAGQAADELGEIKTR
jgi:hypothetical protein